MGCDSFKVSMIIDDACIEMPNIYLLNNTWSSYWSLYDMKKIIRIVKSITN